MPKFFITQQDVQDRCIVLTGENAEHVRVLRMKSGDEITACDDSGMDYCCTVQAVGSDQVRLDILSQRPSSAEPAVKCSVYMAFAKADKLEHVIQKATELGADEIVAFPSAFCVSRPDDHSLAKKLERWQKIAESAAGQCRRGKIPQVLVMPSFRDAVERAARCELALLPYENEKQLSLREAVGSCPYRTVSIMTGPEGGFSAAEVEYACEQGMQVCTLGPRILRCETAPLCALTAVLFAAGALD